MLLGKPLGIELGGDGSRMPREFCEASDEDEILFCFIIYLKVCVNLFLPSFNKLS